MHAWTICNNVFSGDMLVDLVEEPTSIRRTKHAKTTASSSSGMSCLIAMLSQSQVSMARFAESLLNKSSGLDPLI